MSIRIRPIFVISALIFAIGTYLLLSGEVPAATNRSPASVERDSDPKPRQINHQLTNDTKSLIQSCLKDQAAFKSSQKTSEFATLDELMNHAASGNHAVKKKEIQYRNLHLVDREGRQMKMHISPKAMRDGKLALHPRLFMTDNENLQMPKSMPQSLEDIDPETAAEKFRSQGQLVLDEISELYQWGDGAGASLLRRNGSIERLEVFFKGGVLACSSEDESSIRCFCL